MFSFRFRFMFNVLGTNCFSLDSTGQQQLLRPVDIDFIIEIFALKGKALGCIQVFPR